MAIEGMSREKLEECEKQLLNEINTNGVAIGNVTLRSRMMEQNGWTEDLYWEIRNRLIERGDLSTGRGRGGSVFRVIREDTTKLEEEPEAARIPVTQTVQAERDLYGPMQNVIQSQWAQDYRLDQLIVEITASQGARLTGGKWTRPDITVASYKTFTYIPGRHFDVITFEIKPTEAIDITVVYEALGHRRAATKSYALLHVPEEKRTGLDPLLEEIVLEAKRFGIGVIVASDPANYDTWEELIEAVRHEPDPERLNEFLSQQVSQGFREEIIRWFR